MFFYLFTRARKVLETRATTDEERVLKAAYFSVFLIFFVLFCSVFCWPGKSLPLCNEGHAEKSSL